MQYCGKFTCKVFAFIDVSQFKEAIACKNIDYVQRILLSRYFNDFLTFEGVAVVINCNFCTFVLIDTLFDLINTERFYAQSHFLFALKSHL